VLISCVNGMEVATTPCQALPAMTAGLRGSSSGMSFSTLPTRSAPTSAACAHSSGQAVWPIMPGTVRLQDVALHAQQHCIDDTIFQATTLAKNFGKAPWCRCRRPHGQTGQWRSRPGHSRLWPQTSQPNCRHRTEWAHVQRGRHRAYTGSLLSNSVRALAWHALEASGLWPN